MNRAKNRQLPKWSVAALLVAAALPAFAKPVAIHSGADFSITLHDEKCTLKAEITNLPWRAVWLQNGKAVEGCFGSSVQFRLYQFYFADKTAFSIPGQYFELIGST